jgi:hypothetical protein
MKNFVILILSVVILSSCTEVVFKEAQPASAKALKEIPQELRGKFGLVILNEETIMEITANSIVNDDGMAYLSDSLVIKKLDNRYVLSRKQLDGEGDKVGTWQTYVLEDKGCGFVKATSFFINSDSYVEQFTQKFPDNTFIDGGENKTIIIKPTAAQFKELVADDSVTVSMILERLD